MPTVKASRTIPSPPGSPGTPKSPAGPAWERVTVALGSPDADVGGKGRGLARLASAGLPVPPTRVIPARVLRSFLAHHGLAPDADPERARDVITGGAFPPGIAESLVAEVRALGPRLADVQHAKFKCKVISGAHP